MKPKTLNFSPANLPLRLSYSKDRFFISQKVSHKHKSFSLYLNRLCPINDKSCYLWLSEITFPLFSVLGMALRVVLPFWVGIISNRPYFISEKRATISVVFRCFSAIYSHIFGQNGTLCAQDILHIFTGQFIVYAVHHQHFFIVSNSQGGNIYWSTHV